MKIFGIDTTRKDAVVFIVDSKENSESVFLSTGENIKHSEGLFLFVEKILLQSKIKLKDIDAFACVVGPGSFTGIRVGMSTIKGLNKVLNKPIVVMNTFEIISKGVKKGIVLLNSTNTSCYYASIDKNIIIDAGVIDKDKIKDLACEKEVVVLKEEQEIIGCEYNNCKIISNFTELLECCVLDKMNSGDYGEMVPYYLQLSQAERNFK